MTKHSEHIKDTEEKNQSITSKLLATFKYSVERSAGIIIEYPLECMKIRWQANQHISSFSGIIRYSYQKYGFMGFYNGFLPNAVRKVPAQLFRWPLILQMPSYYESLLDNFTFLKKEDKAINGAPITRTENKTSRLFLTNLASAITIATIETPIIAPIDTCRLDLVINREQTKSILDYFKLNASLKLQFLGMGSLYMKELFGWSSFLISCNVLRHLAKEYNAQPNIEPYQILPISLTVGFANATAIMPWDVIRSQTQKNKHIANTSMWSVMHKIIQEHGIKGLFRGWGIRAFQLSVATALSIPVMEQYEKEMSLSLTRK